MTKQNFSVNDKELLSSFSIGSQEVLGGSPGVLGLFSKGSQKVLNKILGG